MSAHELLARAFQADPFASWAEPEPHRRPLTLAAIFAGQLAYSRRHGGSLFELGIGAADWRDGRAAHMGWWSVVTSGVWRVARVAPHAVWRRFAAHENAAMKYVQRFLVPGAVYLSALGVEPSRARQGHGSRLLQKALAAQSVLWSTCVLRTEQPANVAFYQKNGFALVAERLIAESGLRTWIFCRSLSPPTVA